jgi:hypothetical protein
MLEPKPSTEIQWIYDTRSWHLIVQGRTGCGIVVRPLLDVGAPLGDAPQSGSVCYVCKLCSQSNPTHNKDGKVSK